MSTNKGNAMRKILHRFFGIGKHTWKRARANQTQHWKYCDCGAQRIVKRRKTKP